VWFAWQAWSANMPKPAVKKEDLQRLSDEVAQSLGLKMFEANKSCEANS
jgi:isopentenyl diphosphate isomerase/L-lactate dehydrogenase-like FMN-dependent dehydrogenase